jgi:DNA primase
MQTSPFDKSQLPPARSFYEAELGALGRENNRGWCVGRCPFHESKSGKSFSVNLRSGGFFCFGCDAKGGDPLDFVRLRHNFSFRDAKRHLGIDESAPSLQVETVPVKYLVCESKVDGVKYRAEVKDEPVTYRQKIRRFYHDALERMAELGPGQTEAHIQRILRHSNVAITQRCYIRSLPEQSIEGMRRLEVALGEASTLVQ